MKANLKLKIGYILIAILFSIILALLIMMPSITLVGKNDIEMNVGEEFKEPGYKAFWMFKNQEKQVTIKNNIDTKKIGKYKVIYTLKVGKLKAEEVRNIEVVDKKSPEIKLLGNNYVCREKEYEEEGYQAIDNYDGDITDKVLVKRKKDTMIYTVKDSSGNQTEVKRKLIQGDIEAPKISLNGEENIVIHLGDSYQEQGATAIDNCDGSLNDKITISGEVNTNQVGQYTLTYSVVDELNNSSSITRTVQVVIPYNSPDMNGFGKTIYLTFDDGPSRTITPSLLQILREENVKATFFVINHDDSLNYLIKQEYEEGHTVALHSYTHDYSYVYSSVDNYFSDLNAIQNKIFNITGVKSNIIRFPGGSSNTISRKYSSRIMSTLTNKVVENGYYYFDWNVSSQDAGGASNASQVYSSVVNHLVYKNNVVLMHDFENNYKTLNAIRDIIRFGKEHGYTFKTITTDTFGAHHPVNN